ncbi:hypothetical protein BOX15_Mlig007462g3 [Macrostomum lignano]|uniref:Peptidase S54 rhomboid domain-containing protein n=1 Tax=Macrostomum lignano TaxID=282301 RepID=A0A267FLJ8_9PLAT|nr:hypothetical protein BOX15_Mlig007462g3 [Macrostomum lignano]
MKPRPKNSSGSTSLELQQQPLSAASPLTSASRQRTNSYRRRPSVSLLRQVSTRAGNSCMTALGLRPELPEASQKWNQRRLQLLSSYGNLRVSQLPAASGTSAAARVQPPCRRPIDRQLSCPTPRIPQRLEAAPPTAPADVESPLLLRPPSSAASAARNSPSVDFVDATDSGFQLRKQKSLRKENAIKCLFRGVRSLSSGGGSRSNSSQQLPQTPKQEPAAAADRSEDNTECQLPAVPEEQPAGGSGQESGQDVVDGVTISEVGSSVRPRSTGNVFAEDFNRKIEELTSKSGDLLAGRQLAPAIAAPPPQPPSPSLLARLRLSCLTSSDTSELKASIDAHLLFRPYFTYWITLIHIVIFIATVVQFGFAPIGVTLLSTRTATVVNRNTLQAKVCAIDYHNLFLGPRMSDLIRVGAKYSLCMRRYDSLYTQILDRQRINESNSGCCVHNDRSACYQSQRAGCPKWLGTWLKWNNSTKTSHGRLSGPVCGQDPRTCLEPLSLPGDPNAWPDDVSRWPPCHRQQTLSNNNSSNALLSDDLAHLVCPISARPCCVGIKGECVITSQQRCEFMRGSFFPDRQLCSQVNCMSETCGMLGVADPQQPNQFYRVLTSLFLHSGLITLAVTLVHHLLFLRKLEQSLGWHRTAFIYLGSGVVGNLVSMIFLPYLVDVGPTSAQIGSLAPILIELGMSWSHYESKVRPLCLFFLSPLVLILFGFFPWFDNFANLGGLASGLLLSVVLMPYVSYGSSPNAVMLCRRISVAICLTVWLLLLVGLFAAFYLAPLASCDFCVYFNCGPKWFDGYFSDQSHVDYCGNVNLSNLEPTRCIESLSHQLT